MTLLLIKLACRVRCPAFRRQFAVFYPDRLKAGHQTSSLSSFAIVKGGKP